MRQYITIVLAGLLAFSPALAWHEVGHKTTAAIAFDQLSAERQQEVVAILRAHPRFEEDFQSRMPPEIAAGSEYERGKWAMEQASIWPDLVPRLGDEIRTQYNRSRWHYINMLAWLSDGDQAALKDNLDHNMATEYSPPLRQNLNVVQALRGNLAVWRSDDASDADLLGGRRDPTKADLQGDVPLVHAAARLEHRLARA